MPQSQESPLDRSTPARLQQRGNSQRGGCKMTDASPLAEDFAPGRPIVFRNGIVITVDTPGVILGGDVLIKGDTITAVGTTLPVPEGTVEIDASGGILMP